MAIRQPLKIGNAGGFWGDSLQAPARLLKQQPDLDYLTLDFLAEVSLSIMAIQQEKNPLLGYAKDIEEIISSLIPIWKSGSTTKLVTNAGGLSPHRCAEVIQALLKNAGLSKKIGVVSGDDVKSLLETNADASFFHNLETQAPLSKIKKQLVSANAYLGSLPIASLLSQGADIIITGRVADPCLTVGPCLHHYGWKENDYNQIAGATIAGHLIECGTQATGGISTHWDSIQDPANIGFPVVEVFSDGSCVLTKPPKTGGEVSIRVTKEQLLYEIGDPERYLSPDATVSFLGLKLEEEGSNRIRLTGAKGKLPTDTYKVSATYRSGYRADATLVLVGSNLSKKAELCGNIILDKVRQAGYTLERYRVEAVGCGALAPFPPETEPFECMLRISATASSIEALECFSKEIAPLVTSGSQGTTGYISGRAKIRPMFGYWPCLIPKHLVKVDTCLLSS